MVKPKEEEKKKKKRTFKERYESLAKKTREHSVLCGSQYAIIAYSPDGTLHVEGFPSVQGVIDRAYEKGKVRGPKPEWPSPPDESARGVGAVVVATKKGKRSLRKTVRYVTWEGEKRRVTSEPPWRRVRVDGVASLVGEEEMMTVEAAAAEEGAEEEMTRLRL
ncbi:hypothetical protein QJS10_CPB12g00396 [Acorus calamus]|uniref:MADS-box domain-containing protein n=1 Tax=Acorus calamus TaxID=4465 RepID=A0AAV9DNP9_ACOCL|nr:hypothetical protein QJS10_CPB12g00396 [Acorus calamus]